MKEKRRHSLKRKLKYLFLLLLLSFNFNFAFGHINRLQKEIDDLNGQLQTQEVALMQAELATKKLQNALTISEVKINILSKAEPGKVVHTITKVVESVPDVTHHVDLIDPAVVITTAGVVGKFIIDVVSHVPKLIIP